MQTLAIDIETFSSVDLTESGVYKYVESPDFEILLFAYSFDDEPEEVVDLVNEDELPPRVIDALLGGTLKTAHNAAFERACIAKYVGWDLPAEEWECTMVKASMLGLPLSLDAAAKALKLEQKKDAVGKALIKYFCTPCKPTKANGMRTRNMPEHDLAKWMQFIEYCRQDVVVEKAIRRKISFFQLPVQEKKLWQLDQRINETGVLLDPQMVRNAIILDTTNRGRLTSEAVELTGLDNPNSPAQLKKWLSTQTGGSVTSLTKEAIPALLETTQDEDVSRLLGIRQEMAKTSVKKYEAMTASICADNRVRGLLQFYGANRTGRWAGRLVQVQNLPRNEMACLDDARELVKAGDLELLQLCFGNVPNVLSELIRTAFIAAPGHRLIVADFSAIEARVIAWLAGERWRLEVFRTHGKIYEASAAQMFKVPIESVTKGSDLRQKGKVSELALGYQGGPNALIKMGALKMGLSEEELPRLVKMWRNANKAIVAFWETVGNAALTAVEEGTSVTIAHGIRFSVSNEILWIQLPGGRRLAYYKPHVGQNQFGNTSLKYWGMNQTTKQWSAQDTYGGKLVENIVQAVARDCLAHAMLAMDAAGYRIVMHVHDEVVCEMPIGKGSLEEVNRIMGASIPWAKGLPLTADSYETNYYKKD